jgi:Flp pilus assembly protein TadG
MISKGSANATKDGFFMPLTDLTHARRGLSALEFALLAFSIAMIVAITFTL